MVHSLDKDIKLILRLDRLKHLQTLYSFFGQYMNKIYLNIHDYQLKPFIFSLQVTNLMKTRSETTRLSWKELITSFCSWLQLGVQGWMSPISYRPSTAMQRRRRCGFLKRLNRCSLLIMDMILIVPCCCWPSMRLVHYIMKLNWFNTVNNEGRGRGQQSVVGLKHSQPCLHHLHVLSTMFSWWPLSSFSL